MIKAKGPQVLGCLPQLFLRNYIQSPLQDNRMIVAIGSYYGNEFRQLVFLDYNSGSA